MKLKFKHQPFQEDAARAVCAVFEGQQILAGQAKYLMDVGGDTKNAEQVDEYDHHHWMRPVDEPAEENWREINQAYADWKANRLGLARYCKWI